MSDADVMLNIADRSTKVKTFPPLEPQNTGFKTLKDATVSFKAEREKLIRNTKSTKEDSRNHVSVPPVGSFDAYQMMLFIGTHSKRHVKQMQEVMSDKKFPKE